MAADKPRSDLFISFAEENMRDALQLKRAFQSAGLKAWTYSDEQGAGSVWTLEATQLYTCRCVVFVVSEDFLKSSNCLEEVEYARAYFKDPRSRLKIASAVVIDECDFKGENLFWLHFCAHRREEKQRSLSDSEAAEFASGIARQISDLHPGEEHRSEAVAGRPIVTSWSPDCRDVTIRVVRAHPRFTDVCACLRSRFGLQGGKEICQISGRRYLAEVVPALEKICGSGCCPTQPSSVGRST